MIKGLELSSGSERRQLRWAYYYTYLNKQYGRK